MEALISVIFALLIGSVGTWTAFKALRNRAILDRWPTTKGRVIERGTVETVTGRGGFRHAPLVKYVYQVKGQEFVNDYINPRRIQLPSHSSKKWALERAESWPEEVVVHYNPESPNESFLVQTPKIKLYIVIVASVLVILFGLLFWAAR